MTRTSSRLLITNGGSCYGSYGDIPRAIISGSFDVVGTLTQFMGVAPGQVQYDARFSGTVSATQLTITVNVPSTQQHIGPYVLTKGVSIETTRCLYP